MSITGELIVSIVKEVVTGNPKRALIALVPTKSEDELLRKSWRMSDVPNA